MEGAIERMNEDEARARFHDLRKEKDGVAPRELDRIWASLPPLDAGDIRGLWKGAAFQTGHALCQKLTEVRWYGKLFESSTDVKPLMCYNEQGELYHYTEQSMGDASLWNVQFRGEVTATMVYDGQPIFDHFKKVDDSTLMGIMNGKVNFVFDKGEHFYFILECS